MKMFMASLVVLTSLASTAFADAKSDYEYSVRVQNSDLLKKVLGIGLKKLKMSAAGKLTSDATNIYFQTSNGKTCKVYPRARMFGSGTWESGLVDVDLYLICRKAGKLSAHLISSNYEDKAPVNAEEVSTQIVNAFE